MNNRAYRSKRTSDDATSSPFVLTDDMLETAVGGAFPGLPSVPSLPQGGPVNPHTLGVHGWDGNWDHI